jgi:Caspase domain
MRSARLRASRGYLVVFCLLGLVGASRAEEPLVSLLRKGVEAVKAGRFEDAARLLELSMKDGPGQGRSVRTYGVRFVDFLPGYYLGIACYNFGQYEEAANVLNDLLEKRVIKDGDEEFREAQELLSRATVALPAGRGLEAPNAAGEPAAGGSAGSEDAVTRNAKIAARPAASYSRGRYVGIAIANQEYQNFPKLATPIGDARVIASLLEQSYGFDIRLIENASRADVLDGIDEVMTSLSANDNFLIYYAGHGVEDEETNGGVLASRHRAPRSPLGVDLEQRDPDDPAEEPGEARSRHRGQLLFGNADPCGESGPRVRRRPRPILRKAREPEIENRSHLGRA